MWLIEWAKGIFFPRRCILCRRFLKEEETDLCHSCRTDAPYYPFSAANPASKGKNKLHFLDSFTAVWYYEGDVRKSIHRYKFRNAVKLSSGYGRMLAMKLLREGPEQYDILTWVPVSKARLRQRGYDQSELLAQAVSMELESNPQRVLRKIRNTPPQSGISSPESRKANVLGAFSVVPGAALQNKTVLLLDDVYTTGATMEECARVLLTAGAKEVHGAAIAAVQYHK